MDVIEGLVIELEREIAKSASWVRHYDELDKKFTRVCDVLHMLVACEPDEYVDCAKIAAQVLKEVGK